MTFCEIEFKNLELLQQRFYWYHVCLSNRGDDLNDADVATEAANGNVAGVMELAQ
jgi:hypothetical protein